MRNEIIRDADGGMSSFFSQMLRFFFDSATHDLRTSGILLDFGDAEIYLFASHECTIADYEAHAEIVSSRGVVASKPCPCR